MDGVVADLFRGWVHTHRVSLAFRCKAVRLSALACSPQCFTQSIELIEILPGIRRKVLLKLAEEHQIKVVQRLFTIEEATGADEAFLSSASTFVLPSVDIDGQTIGDGKPGPVARRMREIYLDTALSIARDEAA